MPQKLSDKQIGEMRSLYASGLSFSELAERFGVTARHVRRLVDGVVPPEDAVVVGSVEAAVRAFIEGLEERLNPSMLWLWRRFCGLLRSWIGLTLGARPGWPKRCLS
jgi:hypothetical protein